MRPAAVARLAKRAGDRIGELLAVTPAEPVDREFLK